MSVYPVPQRVVSRAGHVPTRPRRPSTRVPALVRALTLADDTNRLLRANESAMDIASESGMCLAFYFKPSSVTASEVVVSKYQASGTDRSWEVQKSVGIFRLVLSADGTTTTTHSVSSFWVQDEWAHVICGLDPTDNEIYSYKDNGSADTPTAFATDINNGTADFTIGGRHGGANAVPGDISGLGWWEYPSGQTRPTAAERTALYNGGKSLHYSGIPTLAGATLKGYWNLDERSDDATPVTRSDSGSNSLHLTDTTDNRSVVISQPLVS